MGADSFWLDQKATKGSLPEYIILKKCREGSPENPTGMIGVGLDGGLELVKTGKLLLSPQALDELDLDDAAVGSKPLHRQVQAFF